MNQPSETLKLPAIRAQIGDWVYYLGAIQLSDIAQRVRLAEVVHPGKSLSELIQRSLDKRGEEIRDYLLNQEERFFSSLVLGVYGGEPEWHDLSIRENPYLPPDELPEYTRMALGILLLPADVQLFALDGQHRLVGIREALEVDPSLGDEQASAVFVGHQNTTEGLQRTRRLFTTLNRYAKPVSKKDAIALDEDDAVAIVTRRLLRDYALFTGSKVAVTKTKSIGVTDTTSFTHVVALYDFLDRYLRHRESLSVRQWKKLKRFRPEERMLQRLERDATKFWDRMQSRFPEIRRVAEGDEDVVAENRGRFGGHLLFRPLGFDLLAASVARLMDQGVMWHHAVDRISHVPMSISNEPWSGVIWSVAAHKILRERKRLATDLLVYGAGGSLSKADRERVRSELGELRGDAPSRVRMRQYFRS